MDGGEVKQFGDPYTLMQDTSGLFHQLVQQTGPANAQMILRSVLSSWKEKQSGKKEDEDVGAANNW